MAVTAILVTAGCSSSGSREDPAAWAGGQDHVAAAELVPYDDPSQGTFLRITLDDGLPDATVEAVVHDVKAHFDDESDPPSIDVDVDGFQASVFPGLVTFSDGVSDPDLDRALWLRADGRATTYGDLFHSTVSSHPRVIAAAADVAQLAIDFDAAVTHEHDVRYSTSVESADGTAGVEWTTSTGLGFGLDPDVVGVFAELQRAHPGTTGWLTSDGVGWKAFVDVVPDEVPLAAVTTGTLVDASVFTTLELGWGPARAAADQFAQVFGEPGLRRVLDDLRSLDGVAEIGEEGVVVRNGTALAAVRAYAARTDAEFRISLLRRPVLYDYPTDPVLTTDTYDPATITAAYTAIADLPGIARLELTESSSFGNLRVDDQVTASELQTAFTALAAPPAPYAETRVYASVPGDYGHDDEVALGTADADGFTPAPAAAQEHPDLLDRVEQAWNEVRNR